MPEAAVRMRNAVKSYSSGTDRLQVLDHLNMTVPTGCIYGLLGASGCGKTTLLSCIAGILKLDEGDLTVLGGVPGSRDSGVPGPRIGYMPQELALVDEFSVKNAIFYFGWLFGMSNSQISERFQFLSKLLDLPPEGKHVRELSGGQQRRLSLAVALVHNSELLILDEPTVGLDPVLRQNIWDYLLKISRDRNLTVVITTHYIEEARQADKIGLMRGGTLLAEMSPERLIAKLNCKTLDQVFLILSSRQEAIESSRNTLQDVDQDGGEREEIEKKKEDYPINDDKLVKYNSSRGLNLLRMKAQLFKNFLRILGRVNNMVFVLMLPLLNTTIFFLAIGGEDKNIHLGYVNDEMGDCSAHNAWLSNYSGVELFGEECHYCGLSCQLMAKLNDGKTINVYYDTVESAKAGTRSGQNLGVIYFPSNFSESLEQRQRDGPDASDDVLEFSQVSVWLDMSDKMVGTMLQRHLYQKYTELANDISNGCEFNVKLMRIPMQFQDPVFGSNNPSVRDFAAPGFLAL